MYTRQVARQLMIGSGLLGFAAAAFHALPASTATASPSVPSKLSQHRAGQAVNTPTRRFAEPRGATVELFVSSRTDSTFEELLERAGVEAKDAAAAGRLVAEALPAGIPDRTEIAILLGDKAAGTSRRLERLSFRPSPALRITVGRTGSGELAAVRDGIDVDARPRRFSGRAGSDLFWSMRAAGVPAQSAREYLEAISAQADVRRLRPEDRFELVIDTIRSRGGEARAGPLLFASLSRQSGSALTLVRWSVGGQSGLFDPSDPNLRAAAFARPVKAGVSSHFGLRIHPILRLARFHQGVDFAARSGSPVLAAADGIVENAQWSGGYGRQVRLVHAGGVVTSYSHLSGFAVGPGARVRRGDLVGFVGSSGFSTGPHLHFEIRRNGRPVDPMSFRFDPGPVEPAELAAMRARAAQLQSV